VFITAGKLLDGLSILYCITSMILAWRESAADWVGRLLLDQVMQPFPNARRQARLSNQFGVRLCDRLPSESQPQLADRPEK
jgi:hypothetical protein